MATATFPVVAASVLAARYIEEFSITRAQVGLLVTAFGLVGAVMSPVFGRFTDVLGSVRSTLWVLASGVIVLAINAAAPSSEVLFAAALLAGIPNGWGNPATNTLIAENFPPGDRGLITGIKQSGVQVGAFLGGLALPILATAYNWRVALLAFLLIPLSGMAGLAGRHSGGAATPERVSVAASMPIAVTWIGVYGFLSGAASSAIFGFMPLFAEESEGWSPGAAGSLVAVTAVAGIVSRIGWPWVSERRWGYGPTLRVLALLSTMSAALLMAADLDWAPSWVMIPAALLLGGGGIAWNAVGMVAVMDLSPPGMVGRGTGIVLFGFLTGLAAGAPLMGFSVDRLGEYYPGWVGSGVLLALGCVVSGLIPKGSTVRASCGS